MPKLAVLEEAPQVQEHAPAPVGLGDSDLVTLLSTLTQQIQALVEKTDRLEAKQGGGFIPMQPSKTVEQISPGQARDFREYTLPQTATGISVDGPLDQMYKRRFQVGQQVRIREEALSGTHEITDEEDVLDRRGRVVRTKRTLRELTYGELFAKSGAFRCLQQVNKQPCGGVFTVNHLCPRCGAGPVIKRERFLAEQPKLPDLMWKYSVVVPGYTGRDGLGDGFYANALEPR